MSVLKFLLLPFAMLYDIIMVTRNRLYDMKLKPSTTFDIPVIGVGNLAIGGTGKTPMVEHLIRQLSDHYRIVTLSRGYGRKTKGYRVAGENESVITVGDEPYQMHKKFAPRVRVVVGEERALAIPTILQEFEDTQCIIMDDAFQHRSVVPGFSILLTEFNRPFYEDHLLPYGRLREGPEGANRADCIVITKCPDPLKDEDVMRIEHGIRRYTAKPIFFSKIRYGEPIGFGDASKQISRKIILLTGIANSRVLVEYVEKHFQLVKHLDFRDHYHYNIKDLQGLLSIVSKNGGEPVSILTTEKDKVKLDREELMSIVSQLPFFFLPIETEFIRNGKDFDTLVQSFMNSSTRE